MKFCPNCSKQRFNNANFCYNCSFDFKNASEIVKNNQDYDEINLLEKIKNTNLEDIKKYIDLTALRSALKVILDLLIKKDIKKVSDLLEKNLINKFIHDLISPAEIEAIAFSDIKKVIDNDQYSKEVVEEMKKQHIRTWELILEGSLFILESERTESYPRIWYKKIDSCAEDAEKINGFIIDSSVTIKHAGLGSEYYYLLLKPKYNELIISIKDYLLTLPEDSRVEETLIGKIKKLILSIFMTFKGRLN
ncbi:zinc ribbon domain-containing protein [Paenibacillus amylolyticus]|uniref:zinc ribbon domain-containing protein n=1 Tax=Paenibacillus amylolyticus TaxID=1451 RepID=UPI003D2CD3DF